jgi:hypothetical protein
MQRPVICRVARQLSLMCACALAVCAVESSAMADIIRVGKDAKLYSPRPSVKNNAWESNKRIRVFKEQTDVPLEQAVQVNIASSGDYRSNSPLVQSTLEEGVAVDSWFIHQDSKNGKRIVLKGVIKFDTPIIGVILRPTELADGDPIVGLSTTLYPTGPSFARGLELGNKKDRIKISADMRKITFRLISANSIDQMRILTLASGSEVPAPGALALLAVAGFLGFTSRRRK